MDCSLLSETFTDPVTGQLQSCSLFCQDTTELIPMCNTYCKGYMSAVKNCMSQQFEIETSTAAYGIAQKSTAFGTSETMMYIILIVMIPLAAICSLTIMFKMGWHKKGAQWSIYQAVKRGDVETCHVNRCSFKEEQNNNSQQSLPSNNTSVNDCSSSEEQNNSQRSIPCNNISAIKDLTVSQNCSPFGNIDDCHRPENCVISDDAITINSWQRTIAKENTYANPEEVNIDELYAQFKQKLDELKTPNYIQGTYVAKKIYIDVNKVHHRDAELFFEKQFPSQLNFIQLVPQEAEEEYIVKTERSSKTTFAAGAEKGIAFLAKAKIQAGNQLLAVHKNHPDVNVQKLLSNETTLEGVMCSTHGPRYSQTGSSAGFVKDQNGTHYILSARHPLTENKENFLPYGTGVNETLPVLTEVYDGQNSQLVLLGDKVWSFYGYSSVQVGQSTVNKAIDIALIKIHPNILSRPHAFFKNEEDKNVNVSTFTQPDEKLKGRYVQKDGPVTMKTRGRIVRHQDIPMTEERKMCAGTFLVEVEGKVEAFAQRGDSGSLVLEILDDKDDAVAYGLCYKIVKNYEDPLTGKKYGYLVRCIRLDQCFQYAKSEWGLDLEFCTHSNNAAASANDPVSDNSATGSNYTSKKTADGNYPPSQRLSRNADDSLPHNLQNSMQSMVYSRHNIDQS